MSIDLLAIKPNTLYSSNEVSKLIHLSRGALSNLRNEGSGPAFSNIRGRVYYKGSEILKHLNALPETVES